jgi:hypothetical protein
VSPIRALRLLQRDRFKDTEEAEGLRNLGSSTFDRWIFAILGPVPMMIKMASFTGTPLTNMYANLFVACFIITELIIVTTPEDLHVGTLHREMEM